MSGSALLLDEMLSGEIAAQLRKRGHDVEAVAADPALVSIDDQTLLDVATSRGRCLVTVNIKDFAVLDHVWKSRGQRHAGILFVATATFRQNDGFVGRVVTALDVRMTEGSVPGPDEVDFLRPAR